jgi:imidazolonepropionase-like amidohydrolase
MHRIEAGLLIPGHGGPVRDGVVVLDGPRISYAGPAGAAPPTPGAPVSRVTAVMPGMWDCHGHLMGTRTPERARGAAGRPVHQGPARRARRGDHLGA